MRRCRPAFIASLVVVMAAGVTSAACEGSDLASFSGERAGERRELREADDPAPLDAPEVGGATLGVIPEVAERVVSSVVNISALRQTRAPDREMHPFYSDPLFRHFFGEPGAQPRERLERSLGSGVIVDADGVILTNNHVVEGAEDVLVALNDGRELEADVVGGDPASDLAVLRIKGNVKDLTPLPIGSSSSLRLGQTVLAIGNPFGVGQTVTMGIVSATRRGGMGIVDYESFIQTDAAINPGNSGGALVDLRGELIGINTAILSETGGYQGIGFAIPSDMAKIIMEDLLDDGAVDRGFLGVHIQDVSRDVVESMQLRTARGALVAQVLEGSPAARAGIERGDVIVSVDGRPVSSAQEVKNIVGLKGSGVTVQMRLLRGNDERVATVELGDLEPRRARPWAQ